MLDNIKIINDKQIAAIISIKPVVDICHKIFNEVGSDKVCSPKKFSMSLPGNSASAMKWINSMPAYLLDESIAGVKWVCVNSSNTNKASATTSGVIILNDLQTGEPIALIDAGLITHYRTAASVLLAAKKFAPNDSKNLTIIGPGNHGQVAALFILEHYDIEKVNVIARSASSADAFKDYIHASFSDDVLIETDASVACCVQESDIVVVATTSMQSVLLSEHLRVNGLDQFICGLTAFNDIEDTVIDQVDNIVFDDSLRALQRIAEISKIDFAGIPQSRLHSMTDSANLDGHTVAGVNLYLPVGISAMDIAIAAHLYRIVTAV